MSGKQQHLDSQDQAEIGFVVGEVQVRETLDRCATVAYVWSHAVVEVGKEFRADGTVRDCKFPPRCPGIATNVLRRLQAPQESREQLARQVGVSVDQREQKIRELQPQRP